MGKQFDYFNAFLEMGRHSLTAGELLKETLETYDPAALKAVSYTHLRFYITPKDNEKADISPASVVSFRFYF